MKHEIFETKQQAEDWLAEHDYQPQTKNPPYWKSQVPPPGQMLTAIVRHTPEGYFVRKYTVIFQKRFDRGTGWV